MPDFPDTAMIFAAGLGTRLRPLTEDRPKALVEVAGRPLLGWQIERLKTYGVKTVVVNVHHFADKVIDYLHSDEFDGLDIRISDEREKLLDTGGGLWKARKLLEHAQHFILLNTDVITDLNLNDLFELHSSEKSLATLAVRERQTSRYLLFGNDMLLKGWINKITGEKLSIENKVKKYNEFAFSGIQIISSDIFKYSVKKEKFGLIPLYLDLAKHYKVCGLDHSSGYWLDTGKPDTIIQAEKYLELCGWI